MTPAERQVARDMAREDLYFFSRYMFLERKRFRWNRAPHHRQVCDALMRVYRGECKRLIINIPPRYSKTELAVVNFIAWALGQVPDAEFIHASYAAPLALGNSLAVRTLVQHEEYRAIFSGVDLAGEAKAHWTTTAGGVMYSAGAGGTITGFGAGKHRQGFGGCFPYGQLVETEIGPVAIGDIVTKQLPIRVWSLNESTGLLELQPIDTFWTNPANDILEIGVYGASLRCTPNHELLTRGGWVPASEIADALDLMNGQAGFFGSLSSGLSRVGRRINCFLRMLRLRIPFGVGKVCGDAGPRQPELDLANHANTDAVLASDRTGFLGAGEDVDDISSGQPCARPALKDGERAVPEGILHVLGLGAPREVVGAVVSAVAIKVSSLVAGWSRAGKRLKDKVRQVAHGDLPADRQVDAKVSIAVAAPLDGAHRDRPAHVAEAGDLIEATGVRYVTPDFVRHVGHADVTYCLEVRDNHNFVLAQSGVIVSNCIIIDDPHKADEATSDTIRQGVIDWFQNTLESRKNSPDTPIILIMQRLHEEDLAGWLLEGGNGEKWEHVCLDVWQKDEQGNEVPLWPEKHSADELRRMERASPYVFAGQYRQRPSPPEGGEFKPDNIAVVDAIPVAENGKPMPIKWVRGWDFGSTTDGDPTVGGKLGLLPDGRLIIADIVRDWMGPDQRDAALVNTAIADTSGVRVSIPQDPGQAGKTQVMYLTRKLAGFSVHSSPESGDKATRARPFASQVNVGNVLMLRAPWNKALINEMRLFPFGKEDDQIDALSRAYSELLARPAPAEVEELEL